jgi:hypothetical protein
VVSLLGLFDFGSPNERRGVVAALLTRRGGSPLVGLGHVWFPATVCQAKF